MDDVDRGILRILRANSREAFVDMARELGTSEGTIRARVRHLLDDGVIREFTIRTAGSAVKAMIDVRVQTDANTSKISTEIGTWPGVLRVWEVTGDSDIVVMVDVESTTALNDIVERIRHVGGTESTRSRLILKEI
ncbi:MAG: Lrp/AsnC family transcriptional regulator [Thermoplasmatota archaeon]